MSLTAVLVTAGAIAVAAAAAMVFAFVRALRREDTGPRLFADAPAPRHARPEAPAPAPAPALLPAAPPEVSHDEYAPPPMRMHGHAHMDGGVLTPVLAPAVMAVAVLRASITAAARQQQQEAQRLRDEAEFPHLRSGQYGDWETGNFTRADAELVRAALAKAGEAA